MLEPHDRRVLLDTLRPPDGYRLDAAVATTYTLDLLTLLGAQLSFGIHDAVTTHPSPEDASSDGLPKAGIGAAALLQAVRSTADRIAVYCQGGAIKPARYRPLIAYLEDSVIEVRAPRGGVFHPKLWVERFQGATPDDVLFRVLVATRNITFDRSWDTLLVLEGPLKERTNAYARNRPLSDFISTLPSLACAPVAKRAKTLTANIAEDLLRVDFEIPAPFEDLQFWPLGHDGKRRDPLPARRDRVLVISPFVTKDRLDLLASTGSGHVLVGRPDELESIPETLLQPFACHVLHENADEPSEVAPTSEEAPTSTVQPMVTTGVATRGLHAKLYVIDAGWDAHVFTGSANATGAALGANVEFLVQLTGKKSKVGVEATLTMGEPVSLRSVLAPFTPSAHPTVPDPIAEALEQTLRQAQTALGCSAWVARVTQEPSADERYEIVLSAKGVELPPAVRRVRARPITIADDQMSPMTIDGGAASVRFGRLSFQALTSFFVIEVLAEHEGHEVASAFVINARLEGAPTDRGARILQSILQDRASVLKFLYMLLALDPEALGKDEEISRAVAGANDVDDPARAWSSTPLLESMLRALDREPVRLEEIHRTITDLRSTPEGARLLPDELDRIWNPIWEAHQRLQTRRPNTEGTTP